MKLIPKILSEVPEGQIIKLQDGALATRTGESHGFLTLTEVTHQHDTYPGCQFYYSGDTIVYVPEEDDVG